MQKIKKYLFLLFFCVVSFGLIAFINAVSYPFEGMIDADSMVIREKASNDSKELTQLVYGSKVTVIGEEKSFYKINYDTNKTGYVLKNYVLDYKSYASTSGEYRTYCDSLIAKGFVESYCPQLYYLHSLHPNWEFTADVTGLDLEEAAKKEESKTVLQTGNSNYWLNDKPIEDDYYYIKANVIKSFMDPRNLMYEDHIFQFLDLQSSKDITNDKAMAKIVGTKGNLRNYYQEFTKAGLNNNINPLHLLVRSTQEGTNKTVYDEETKTYVASYSAVTGLYTTNSGHTTPSGISLDGYYNFYNIGSYAEKDKGYNYTVQRGLAYGAGFLEKEECLSYKELEGSNKLPYYDSTKCGELSYLRPWNTPEKAIVGGADFIGNSYVKKGQDTLYYQKFNIASYHNYSLYTHQYMTNVMAPLSEGDQLFNAYKEGDLLESKFNFIIPVFKDLAGEISEPIDKNGDATLKEIKINDVLINGFDKDVVEYPYSLQTNEMTFNVTAIPNNPLTKVEGTGNYTFEEGTAKVTIKATAEDGTVKIYVVEVKQIVIDNEIKVKDITDKLLVKIDDNIVYGISPGMSVNELINSIVGANGTSVVTDSSGIIKESGKLVTGDIVTINGSVEKKTFTIAIRGDINGDGESNLKDFVLIQSHILKKSTISGIKLYSADINYDDIVNLKDFVLVQSHILKIAML